MNFGNIEFNLENINLLVSEVLSMKLVDINNSRYHYYKKRDKSDFNTIREYWIDVYEENGYIYVARLKKIDGKEHKNTRRSYKIENKNWSVLLSDFSMRTFSASDSLDEDYMLDCLRKVIREKAIKSILN